MRLLGVLSVLCLIATPALAMEPNDFCIDVDPATSFITLECDGDSTTSDLNGCFCVRIFHNDGHIGASDEIQLISPASCDPINLPCDPNVCFIYTSDYIKLKVHSLATATIQAGDFRIMGFMHFDPNYETEPAHIKPGGDFTFHTDALIEATVVVTGLLTTTLETTTSLGENLTVYGNITTTVYASETFTITLAGTGVITIHDDILGDIDIDVILGIEGTAHFATPDPSLGGLTALGVAGASAWLRKRRR